MYPSNRNHHRRQPSDVHTLLDDDRGSAAATTTAPPLPLPSLALPAAQFQMAPVLTPPPFPDGRAAALAFPATPPTTHDSDLDPRAAKILSTATHVLSTEATALSCLSRLYATDPLCRDGFVRAVEAIVASQGKAGKIVVIGVGKSGKIGDKLVASMNSLGLMSVFLNPVEALHGDLGIVRKNDVLLLITFSGKTPELLNLLPHLPMELPLIALTSHTSYHTLPLVGERGNTILLPTPIPESEVASFGIAAPTTSTTVTMALGDALALASADRLHSCTGAGEPIGPREVFRRNHPGGAIGIANSLLMDKGGVERIRALAVCWADIPIADEQGLSIGSARTAGQPPPSPVISETSSESEIDLVDWDCSSGGGGADLRAVSGNAGSDDRKRSSNRGGAAHYPSGGLRVLDCLLTAVKSAKGWLRTRDGGLIPPRKLMAASHHLYAEVNAPELGLVADVNDLIKVSAESSVNEAAQVLYSRRSLGELTDDTVVVIIENGKALGVVEVGDVIRRGGL